MKIIFQLFCLSSCLCLIFPSQAVASGDNDTQVVNKNQKIDRSEIFGNQFDCLVKTQSSDAVCAENTSSIFLSLGIIPQNRKISTETAFTNQLASQMEAIQTTIFVDSRNEGSVMIILPEETVTDVQNVGFTTSAIAATRSETLNFQIKILNALDALPGETVMVPLTFSSKSVVPRGNQTPGEMVIDENIFKKHDYAKNQTRGILGLAYS
jgi:hypothetical protein